MKIKRHSRVLNKNKEEEDVLTDAEKEEIRILKCGGVDYEQQKGLTEKERKDLLLALRASAGDDLQKSSDSRDEIAEGNQEMAVDNENPDTIMKSDPAEDDQETQDPDSFIISDDEERDVPESREVLTAVSVCADGSSDGGESPQKADVKKLSTIEESDVEMQDDNEAETQAYEIDMQSSKEKSPAQMAGDSENDDEPKDQDTDMEESDGRNAKKKEKKMETEIEKKILKERIVINDDEGEGVKLSRKQKTQHIQYPPLFVPQSKVDPNLYIPVIKLMLNIYVRRLIRDQMKLEGESEPWGEPVKAGEHKPGSLIMKPLPKNTAAINKIIIEGSSRSLRSRSKRNDQYLEDTLSSSDLKRKSDSDSELPIHKSRKLGSHRGLGLHKRAGIYNEGDEFVFNDDSDDGDLRFDVSTENEEEEKVKRKGLSLKGTARLAEPGARKQFQEQTITALKTSSDSDEEWVIQSERKSRKGNQRACSRGKGRRLGTGLAVKEKKSIGRNKSSTDKQLKKSSPEEKMVTSIEQNKNDIEKTSLDETKDIHAEPDGEIYVDLNEGSLSSNELADLDYDHKVEHFLEVSKNKKRNLMTVGEAAEFIYDDKSNDSLESSSISRKDVLVKVSSKHYSHSMCADKFDVEEESSKDSSGSTDRKLSIPVQSVGFSEKLGLSRVESVEIIGVNQLDQENNSNDSEILLNTQGELYSTQISQNSRKLAKQRKHPVLEDRNSSKITKEPIKTRVSEQKSKAKKSTGATQDHIVIPDNDDDSSSTASSVVNVEEPNPFLTINPGSEKKSSVDEGSNWHKQLKAMPGKAKEPVAIGWINKEEKNEETQTRKRKCIDDWKGKDHVKRGKANTGQSSNLEVEEESTSSNKIRENIKEASVIGYNLDENEEENELMVNKKKSSKSYTGRKGRRMKRSDNAGDSEDVEKLTQDQSTGRHHDVVIKETQRGNEDDVENPAKEGCCPICDKKFSMADLPVHASSCGEDLQQDIEELPINECIYCHEVIPDEKVKAHQRSCAKQAEKNVSSRTTRSTRGHDAQTSSTSTSH